MPNTANCYYVMGWLASVRYDTLADLYDTVTFKGGSHQQVVQISEITKISGGEFAKRRVKGAIGWVVGQLAP